MFSDLIKQSKPQSQMQKNIVLLRGKKEKRTKIKCNFRIFTFGHSGCLPPDISSIIHERRSEENRLIICDMWRQRQSKRRS